MAINLLPFDIWESQITQASIPANNNALRCEVLFGTVISIEISQPVSPNDGDLYILGDGVLTGDQWSTFDNNNLVIFKSGTWYEFNTFIGLVKSVGESQYMYTSAGWAVV